MPYIVLISAILLTLYGLLTPVNDLYTIPISITLVIYGIIALVKK